MNYLFLVKEIFLEDSIFKTLNILSRLPVLNIYILVSIGSLTCIIVLSLILLNLYRDYRKDRSLNNFFNALEDRGIQNPRRTRYMDPIVRTLILQKVWCIKHNNSQRSYISDFEELGPQANLNALGRAIVVQRALSIGTENLQSRNYTVEAGAMNPLQVNTGRYSKRPARSTADFILLMYETRVSGPVPVGININI